MDVRGDMIGIFSNRSLQRNKPSIPATPESSFGYAYPAKRPASPLAGVLGRELHCLEQKEAALRSEGARGEALRSIRERIAELQDGMAAVEF